MQLEDYFDFLAPDDIRVKSTRIGIESILYEFIHRAQSPEEIVQRFTSLDLEQVYATILYYLHNKAAVYQYLNDYLAYCRQAREDYERDLPPVVARLRRLKAERTWRSSSSPGWASPGRGRWRWIVLTGNSAKSKSIF